jgi:hypothetical protein
MFVADDVDGYGVDSVDVHDVDGVELMMLTSDINTNVDGVDSTPSDGVGRLNTMSVDDAVMVLSWDPMVLVMVLMKVLGLGLLNQFT